MRICFVASEVAPLAKTGGLADVAGALPRHLHEQGHDIREPAGLRERRDFGSDEADLHRVCASRCC